MVIDDPGSYASTVQIHAHDAADFDGSIELRRNDVVEFRFETSDVGDDANDAPGRRVLAQTPMADLKSARREMSSQVNSLSLRPKCP